LLKKRSDAGQRNDKGAKSLKPPLGKEPTSLKWNIVLIGKEEGGSTSQTEIAENDPHLSGKGGGAKKKKRRGAVTSRVGGASVGTRVGFKEKRFRSIISKGSPPPWQNRE